MFESFVHAKFHAKVHVKVKEVAQKVDDHCPAAGIFVDCCLAVGLSVFLSVKIDRCVRRQHNEPIPTKTNRFFF